MNTNREECPHGFPLMPIEQARPHLMVQLFLVLAPGTNLSLIHSTVLVLFT